MERRLLCMEMYPGIDQPDRWIPCNTPATRFHFPLEGSWQDVPAPSTRALAILKTVGVDVRPEPDGDDDEGVAPEGTPWEPIGHLKFGRADPEKPIEAQSTRAEWMETAGNEFAVSRFAVPILNWTDAELEESMRRTEGGPEPWLDLAEGVASMVRRYEAGAETLNAVLTRLMIVLERVVPKEGDAAA